MGSLIAIFVATLIGFYGLTTGPAFSWFDNGHRIVALIAQVNLKPETANKIEEILGERMTLADAAVWPDHEGRSVRDFNPLHYVSIPETAAGYDRERDCPERNCMVEALNWFLTVIADKHAPIAVRRVALCYVAHLVGDMHQPLHAGRAADRGGVDFPVSYRGVLTNLHFFWDKDLVDFESGSDAEIAKRLVGNFTQDEQAKWHTGDPVQWTNESLALVRSHSYETRPSSEISEDYVEKVRPIVRIRLTQAGIRLAWLLNRAFKKE